MLSVTTATRAMRAAAYGRALDEYIRRRGGDLRPQERQSDRGAAGGAARGAGPHPRGDAPLSEGIARRPSSPHVDNHPADRAPSSTSEELDETDRRSSSRRRSGGSPRPGGRSPTAPTGSARDCGRPIPPERLRPCRRRSAASTASATSRAPPPARAAVGQMAEDPRNRRDRVHRLARRPAAGRARRRAAARRCARRLEHRADRRPRLRARELRRARPARGAARAEGRRARLPRGGARPRCARPTPSGCSRSTWAAPRSCWRSACGRAWSGW